jgi:hypothetical protein
MARTLPVCALLVLLPCVVWADDASAPTVAHLTVTPQAAPRPALRYQLLPELREMNPGNPVQGFLTCFMEQNSFFSSKEEVENREKWLTMPLKELPIKKLHDYGGACLRQADYAARLDKPDWQILLKMRQDGFNTLLPDVQAMRRLAEALKVRCRAEVAERRFDDALVTSKTMFALSRCLGRHPTMTGQLVAAVIASRATSPVAEMIQQPGCPNLYWALTDLPTPFLDLREARQGERDMTYTGFQMLDEKNPMSEVRLNQALDHFGELVQAATPVSPEVDKESPKSKDELRAWVTAHAGDAEGVRAARKRLVQLGLTDEAVKQFPAVQVVLLDEKYEYISRTDEELKTIALPYWEAEKLLAANAKKRPPALFFLLHTGVYLVRQNLTVRLDQRIALLRCVEALRMYAAENDGKLPAKLSDVKLPLPVDPVTGNPFSYQLDGAKAVLHNTPSAGREKDPAYNARYEVTIVK